MKFLNNINYIISKNICYRYIQSANIEEFFEFNQALIKKYSLSFEILIKDNFKFYRGTESVNKTFPFMELSPKKRKTLRTTIMNYDFILEVFKNSNYFKTLPNRQKSLIFTNSYDNAQSFGDVALVFPENSALLAVVHDDFNYSSLRKNQEFVGYLIRDIIRQFKHKIFAKYDSSKLEISDMIEQHSTSKNDEVQEIESIITKKFKYYENKYGTYIGRFYLANYLLTEYLDYGNIYNYFNDYYNDETTTFKTFIEEFIKYEGKDIKNSLFKTFETLGKDCIKPIIMDKSFIKNFSELDLSKSGYTESSFYEFWSENQCLLIDYNTIQNVGERKFKALVKKYI